MRTITKEQQARWNKTWYEKNKEKRLAYNRATMIKSQEFIWQYLSNNSCVDCGESDPIVLDFDHQGDKTINVCEMLRLGFSIATIQLEIDKCLVRCANCHRRKTAKDFKYWKFKYAPQAL